MLIVSRIIPLLLLFLCLFFVIGCASIGHGDPRDPVEGFNRRVYSFNKTMDKAVFDPVSGLYKMIIPEIVDMGITNMLSNLDDISVIANDILQLKFGQALSDLARFVFNTMLGMLGFFDVSTGMGFAKHDEGFSQTLATWGVDSGPYLMAPFFGPSTLRDAIGFVFYAGLFGSMFYIEDDLTRAGLLTLKHVDFKADLTSVVNIVKAAALDEYEFVKNAYLSRHSNWLDDGEIDFEEDIIEIVTP